MALPTIYIYIHIKAFSCSSHSSIEGLIHPHLIPTKIPLHPVKHYPNICTHSEHISMQSIMQKHRAFSSLQQVHNSTEKKLFGEEYGVHQITPTVFHIYEKF